MSCTALYHIRHGFLYKYIPLSVLNLTLARFINFGVRSLLAVLDFWCRTLRGARRALGLGRAFLCTAFICLSVSIAKACFAYAL